jgi:four helix bundle protein
MKTSIVKEKSYTFALHVIHLARWLRERREYELAGQVLRAGTSIGANIEEALAGISRPDFVAKMGLASKEARETYYWLRLLRDSKITPSEQIHSLIDDAQELLRILTSIVKTSQQGKSTHNSKLKTPN